MRGLEMPVASAATSASRTAIRARPNRLCATLALIQVQKAANADAEIVIAPGGIEGRGKFRADNADAAAGDALPGQRDLRDDGGEAERRHREIERAQPQRRQADDDAEHGADAAGDRQCREYRHRRHDIAGDQHAGGVGAERQQRDIADGQMSGEADDRLRPETSTQ